MRLLLVLPLALLLGGCPPTQSPDTAAASCGAETCGPAQVCLQEAFPPECTNREDTGADCPEGTTATRCGGAGMPCCCGPEPERAHQCLDVAPACDAAPSCECLGDVCPDDKACVALASDRDFLCEELPKP